MRQCEGDTGQLTHDMWHMTDWERWNFSHNFSSLALIGSAREWINVVMKLWTTKVLVEQPRLHRICLRLWVINGSANDFVFCLAARAFDPDQVRFFGIVWICFNEIGWPKMGFILFCFWTILVKWKRYPDHEVAGGPRLEGSRDDDVAAGGQLEPR